MMTVAVAVAFVVVIDGVDVPAQERELQQAHSLLKGAAGRQQQQQQQRVGSDFVDRLESLEHELNQLKRRTPTMLDSR